MILILPIPSEEWGDCPTQGSDPNGKDAKQSSIFSHRLSGDSIHDDVVPIKCYHCHGPNRHAAE